MKLFAQESICLMYLPVVCEILAAAHPHEHLGSSGFLGHSDRSLVVVSGFNLYLITNDVDGQCLFAICIFSLMKCLLKSLAPFLIGFTEF